MNSVGVRVQNLRLKDQALVLARLVETRADDGLVAPKAVGELFFELGLPAPARVANVTSDLARDGMLTTGKVKGKYKITPKGRAQANKLVSQTDLAALHAEVARYGGSALGNALHATVPPNLAPPELMEPLERFLEEHPFDTNVFGMTRFPDASAGDADPVGKALDIARGVCESHGLEFHLASDRAMHDDLWKNVTAHMWASRYGIGFFEDLVERGLNHNLTIEVGGMLTTGRRCALLKDASLPNMPTDFVGLIYKPVTLSDASSVEAALHAWIRDDLALGSCGTCPPK